MIFIKLAWRNLFRNRNRTVISVVAISIGLAALIFYHGLFYGTKNNMYRTATETFLGDAQIHHSGYRRSGKPEEMIQNLKEITGMLEGEEIVKAYSPRVYSFAMISSPSNVASVQLLGINPSKEKLLSTIDDNIAEGEYLSGTGGPGLIIGKKLARILNAGIGDRIVITVSEANTGDLAQNLFRVSGIFDTGDRNMDRSIILAGIDEVRGMLSIGENCHEIAVDFTSLRFGLDDQLFFWNKYSRFGNEAVSWKKLAPQLVSAYEMSENITAFVGLIMFVLVAFVILNTVFMSLYERVFEFGVLLAQGTRPFQMAKLIVFESISLSVLSIAGGSILGLLVTLLFGRVGLSYEGAEFMNVTMTRAIYPVLEIKPFITYSLSLLASTFIISLYPAVHAARMKPSKALSKVF
ncbi:MAG TPA: FtsX-like permease family protein [Candidatus Krumholzibacteriaceae bacterium]|nr:FtsX-like permease family protein [Candidatus Krumholzibacteriaceae bacterium]